MNTNPTNAEKLDMQFAYLRTLQAVYQKEAIRIKTLEGAIPENHPYTRNEATLLYSWTPWNNADATTRKTGIPIYTRGTLLNEVFLDPDNPNWQHMREDMNKILAQMEADNIPVWERAFSGGKGIHISFLFNVSRFPEALEDRLSKADIDVYKVCRGALFEELFKRAGVDPKAACMDMGKVNFNIKSKGSQVRMIGTTRPDGMYKTQVDVIPENKPSEPLPLRLPEGDPVLWDVVDTHYEQVILDALYKECEQADKAGDIKIDDKAFEGLAIAQFPCMQKLFSEGVNGVGRYYAARSIVQLTAKCGGERYKCEANATRWLNEKTDLMPREIETRVKNAMSALDDGYPFSCKKLKDELGEGFCNFAKCPKKDIVNKIKEESSKVDRRENVLKMYDKLNKIEVPETSYDVIECAKDFIINEMSFLSLDERAFITNKEIKEKFGFTNSIIDPLLREAEKRIRNEKCDDATFTEQQTWNGRIVPEGYLVEDDTLYYVRFKLNEETGNMEKKSYIICHTPCIISNTGGHIDTGEQWVEVSFLDLYKKKVSKWVQQKDVLTRSGVMALTNQGINIVEEDAKTLNNYFSEVLVYNAKNYNQQIVTAKNGWKQDNELFVLGDSVYSIDRVQPVLMLQQRASEGLHTGGTLQGWAEGVKDVIGYDIVRFKCYTAMSAMLLNLLGIDSCIVDNSGESSTGKSASSRTSASMFGQYVKMEVNGNATQTGVEILAESYSDLPLFLDETATQADERFLKNIIYMVGNGQGRLRGNKDVTLRDVATWKTIAFTTGEQPINTHEAFTGQQVRVINIRGGLPDGLGDEVKNAYDAIKKNYGWIAPLFIKSVLEHKDDLQDRFSEYRRYFSNTQSNTGDRLADHFAVFTLAGDILEGVFADVGIKPRDPKEITSVYFKTCVTDKPIESYSMRALKDVVDWIEANVNGFYSKHNSPKAKAYGWIEDVCIDILPKTLKNAIKECGYSAERVLPEWAEAGLLDVQYNKDGKITYDKVTTKMDEGKKQSKRVIRFIRCNVEAKLGFDMRDILTHDTQDESKLSGLQESIKSYIANNWKKPINTANVNEVIVKFCANYPDTKVSEVSYLINKICNID